MQRSRWTCFSLRCICSPYFLLGFISSCSQVLTHSDLIKAAALHHNIFILTSDKTSDLWPLTCVELSVVNVQTQTVVKLLIVHLLVYVKYRVWADNWADVSMLVSQSYRLCTVCSLWILIISFTWPPNKTKTSITLELNCKIAVLIDGGVYFIWFCSLYNLSCR